MKHFNFPKFLISVFLILFLCACTAHKCVTEGIKNTEIYSESGSNKMTYIQNTTITSYSHETGFLNDNLSSTGTMKQTRCPSSELSITETIENNKSTFYWTTKEYINSTYNYFSEHKTEYVTVSTTRETTKSAVTVQSSVVTESETTHSTQSNNYFNVNDWVEFAIAYGTEIGLEYIPEVKESWDNPIIASPNSIYLERDIKSRLNRYLADGITTFSVWAEPRDDGRYDIYIGYA